MDKTLAIVIVAGIFSVLVIFFFTRFLGKGKFKVKVPFGEATGGPHPLDHGAHEISATFAV